MLNKALPGLRGDEARHLGVEPQRSRLDGFLGPSPLIRPWIQVALPWILIKIKYVLYLKIFMSVAPKPTKALWKIEDGPSVRARAKEVPKQPKKAGLWCHLDGPWP